MDTKATTVFGIFPDVSSLQCAAMALRDAEYRNTAVSVLFPDKRRATDSAPQKKDNAPEGVTVGSRVGAVVGGLSGWLMGRGEFTVAGLDSIIVAGPLIAALAGVGAGGVVGGILGALL